ncbi:hypothetical protein BU23DRAFT_438861, partial [Bimuria novae-zelandiae CBS 107.79]
ITVAFFPSSSSCDPNNTSSALTLTTSTIPAPFTCFDVSSLFSSSNTTGFSPGDTPFSNPDELPTPNGVYWSVDGLDNYDANANYTRNSSTGKVEVGKDAHWVFYMYAFEDCMQLGGDDFDMKDYPWFETSCQTKEGGQCREVPRTIKSLALNTAERYDVRHGGCETWAYLGSGA